MLLVFIIIEAFTEHTHTHTQQESESKQAVWCENVIYVLNKVLVNQNTTISKQSYKNQQKRVEILFL